MKLNCSVSTFRYAKDIVLVKNQVFRNSVQRKQHLEKKLKVLLWGSLRLRKEWDNLQFYGPVAPISLPFLYPLEYFSPPTSVPNFNSKIYEKQQYSSLSLVGSVKRCKKFFFLIPSLSHIQQYQVEKAS